MKFRSETASLLAFLLAATDLESTSAWSLSGPCAPSLHGSKRSKSFSPRRRVFTSRRLAASTNDNLNMESLNSKMGEFEYLLQETADPSVVAKAQANTSGRRNFQLQVGDHQQKVILASSTAAMATEDAESAVLEEGEAASADAYDPYAEVDYQQQLGKIQSLEQAPPSLEDRFKSMDLQDIITTLILPAIISFAGLRWGFNKVSGRVAEKADTLLDQFASEMVFHDGDMEELRMCHADYSRQLMWLGPRKGDAMIKRFLEAYAKKKTVSPQAIGTLSYVFTLFKLSEVKAADTLVSLCREMGADKVSSAGKILFFGSRILKTPEGKQELEPIKDIIKGTYRDEAVAETLVETSQQAMGEAAYRSTVLAGGKKQKSLTAGWEILGLDKETATRIFEDAQEDGFVSEREAMYGGQAQKYDKKGRVIDDEGKLKNPEEAAEDDDDDDDSSATSPSNVYVCGNCGYTLFIAKGREFKFYGDDFSCPECGAKKDQFKPANIEED
ncbi:expressed unknown protein [Seminavis robusta]|uniref:Rubredoxin-like domain-containing protein n=1 Tax=Seminavis robusta TaxID=568900 RepID=A0A9N8H9G3_9STRA|nr:expressed unknown protein [Seminavis robusta]|eukprot:Sro117_g057260.1 n/a (500) ;mRNA; r:11205-12978